MPTKTIQERGTTYCGQWDSVQTGDYTVYNDLWGISAAKSGSQCFGVDGLSGSTLKWHTTWSWSSLPSGQSSVKSYANAVVSLTPTPLSRIKSIPSTWNYTQTGNDVVADISYDMFTSSSAEGAHEFEVMIWLAALSGAGPISSTYAASGAAAPIARAINLAGKSWNLYKGPNQSTTVFSFVATEQVLDFSGDLLDFFVFLEGEGLGSTQFVTSIGAGTEPFSGSNAELKVTGYSTTIQYA
ncbi:endoglucanase A precursor [Usnea florida]